MAPLDGNCNVSIFPQVNEASWLTKILKLSTGIELLRSRNFPWGGFGLFIAGTERGPAATKLGRIIADRGQSKG